MDMLCMVRQQCDKEQAQALRVKYISGINPRELNGLECIMSMYTYIGNSTYIYTEIDKKIDRLIELEKEFTLVVPVGANTIK